jgi:type IV secretion system protein VirB9
MLCALSLVSTALVVGCKTAAVPDVVTSPDERLVPAKLDEANSDLPTTQPAIEYVPVASPQLRQFADQGEEKPGPTTASDAVKALVDAKNGNTQVPQAGDFINANQVYDYAPGVVFTAVCSPGFVTTLVLDCDEQITAVTAGDTSRWQLETVQGGGGGGGADGAGELRTFILLKPLKPECETNLVLVTDQRLYQLDLKSVSQPVYHTQISWNYPADNLNLIKGKHGGAGGQPNASSESLGRFNIDELNFNYVVKRQKGEPPVWTPLRAFDDGAKTYIQFPPQRLTSEAPPLFILSSDGQAQVVNYRVKGDYYIVDRLFDRAELRLGENPQQLVRIERGEIRK